MDRITTATYDADGNVVAESLTGGGVTQTETMTYNAMDQQLSQTVDNTGGNLTTSVVRDQRGLVISQTDPDGNTTTIANDEAGRPVVETGPAVAEPDRQRRRAGHRQPGHHDRLRHLRRRGRVLRRRRQRHHVRLRQDGQQVSVTDPSYTPPGSSTPVNGTTTMTYNKLGAAGQRHRPAGQHHPVTYDQLGDLASQTDPGGGIWTYTYDPAGRADQRHRPDRGADAGHLRQPRPHGHRHRPGPAEHLRRLHHHLRLRRRR